MTKFLHTCVRVKDLEASLQFYQEALGFKEVRRNDFPEYKFTLVYLSLIHISEPTRLGMISYAVFCLKKKKHITEEYYELDGKRSTILDGGRRVRRRMIGHISDRARER